MGMFDSFNINASGLTAQRYRMDVISENIANANTTRTEDGTPYKRKVVTFDGSLVVIKLSLSGIVAVIFQHSTDGEACLAGILDVGCAALIDDGSALCHIDIYKIQIVLFVHCGPIYRTLFL